MQKINYNTTALISSLKSNFKTLRDEAGRLVSDAMKTEGTQQAAAAKLDVNDRSLRKMLTLLREDKSTAKRTSKKTKSRR